MLEPVVEWWDWKTIKPENERTSERASFEMAAAAVGLKEQDEKLEGAHLDAALGLEDGEHVVVGEGDDTKLDEGNVETGKEEEVASAMPVVVTDIEKKRRRAERFGTDLKISEAEKRKLRAARFNDGTKNGADVVMAEAPKTAAATKVPVAAKSALSAEAKSALIAAENAKRKARAERFGSVPQELTVEPKVSKNEGSAKPKFSQDEEAKKKARMARFAMAAK